MNNLKKLAACLSLLIFANIGFASGNENIIQQNDIKLIRGGNITTIYQVKSKAILNIVGFSMSDGEVLDIKQPSKNSILLIRCSGGKSILNGLIRSNGKIILVNTAGITFGKTSVVKVGSIVASGYGVSNEYFLSNRFHFKS